MGHFKQILYSLMLMAQIKLYILKYSGIEYNDNCFLKKGCLSNTATKCTTLTDNSVIAQKIPPW